MSLAVLPRQHRRHNLWLQIVAWTKTGCCYEIDGCEFGSLKAHALGGVEHFALVGIVDENLKVLRAFLNHDPQSIPFGFLSLPVAHSSDSLSYCFTSIVGLDADGLKMVVDIVQDFVAVA